MKNIQEIIYKDWNNTKNIYNRKVIEYESIIII